MALPAWGAAQPGRAALSPASPGRDVQEGFLEGTRARALKAVRALTDEARPPGLLPCVPTPAGPTRSPATASPSPGPQDVRAGSAEEKVHASPRCRVVRRRRLRLGSGHRPVTPRRLLARPPFSFLEPGLSFPYRTRTLPPSNWSLINIFTPPGRALVASRRNGLGAKASPAFLSRPHAP